MSNQKDLKVLVTGGSGYLGQFIVEEAARAYKVVALYHSKRIPSSSGQVTVLECDMTVVSSIEAIFDSHGPFATVVNTAALSQAGLCQKNPDLARAINVPKYLLGALERQRERAGVDAVLIHISTDQVYDGSRPNWREGDVTHAVNVYGQTKVEAENLVRQRWQRHVILRSSLILGPQAPSPVPRPLFLDFVRNALEKGGPAQFFTDQFRSPVFVWDIAKAVVWAAGQPEVHGKLPENACGKALGTFNCGGPDRLNRWDMAVAVARHRGLDMSAASAIPSMDLGPQALAAPGPLDISMDSSKLYAVIPFAFTRFEDGLERVFDPGCQPSTYLEKESEG